MWQRLMIALARSARLRHLIQHNRWLASLSRRFVGGRDEAEALDRAGALAEDGRQTSVYYLGEYVREEGLIEQNVGAILSVIDTFGAAGKEIHVSVDPTQIGYALSDELGWANARRIGQVLAGYPTAKFMMIDMEDYSYLDKTLALYEGVRAEGLPVAITLQAYLYRTAEDVQRITAQAAAIRLVKGAFAERREIAWTKKRDIDASFLALAQTLLAPERRERGVYPIFATHDHRMIEQIKPLLRDWQGDQYEFEMLLGVREPLQEQLVQAGYPLRLYVPFGTEWWAYTARRIGENPANLRFVGRAIMRSTTR